MYEIVVFWSCFFWNRQALNSNDSVFMYELIDCEITTTNKCTDLISAFGKTINQKKHLNRLPD